MQSLVFLWFEMQMTQQYLRGKTFGAAPSSANPANLNPPIDAGMLASVKQAPRVASAKRRTRNEHWRISPPRAQAATNSIEQPKHP